MLNFIKPKKIFTFNNRFATTYPIIAAAEKFNIDILIHERGSDLNKFEIYKRDVHDINLIKKSIKNWMEFKNCSGEIEGRYILSVMNSSAGIEGWAH